MAKSKARQGESIEKVLRSLKKKMDREKTLQTVRANRYASPPSIKKREKSKAAAKFKR